MSTYINIGSVVTFENGAQVQCVEGNDSEYCLFNLEMNRSRCSQFQCSAHGRHDRRDVIFIPYGKMKRTIGKTAKVLHK